MGSRFWIIGLAVLCVLAAGVAALYWGSGLLGIRTTNPFSQSGSSSSSSLPRITTPKFVTLPATIVMGNGGTGEIISGYTPPPSMQNAATGFCDASQEGQTRNSPDDCNVCLCRGGSWTCTHYACTSESEWNACAANSDCAANEICSTSQGDCNMDCRRGMQACGPGVCGGRCIPAGPQAARCGDNRCDAGEANVCGACEGFSCASVPCLLGTCPADCAA